MFLTEFMFTWPKLNLSEEFCFISCKWIVASVTTFVSLEDVFRNLDRWLTLQLSDVRETSTSVVSKNAFLNCLEPVTFLTEVEDTCKWALSKLLSALLSAPKEPLFLDIILKSTVLTVDLDASSKNHYILKIIYLGNKIVR